jgi:uncharacterized membrane protein YeaQ/YmgE (transglycosylase-associated protein family)
VPRLVSISEQTGRRRSAKLKGLGFRAVAASGVESAGRPREEGEVDHASTNLIVTLVIGGVIGWLASVLMRTNAQMGIVANIIVGIVGSFLGVFLANALGVRAQTTPASWIVAILGAALLIGILRSLGVFKRVARTR